MQGRSPLTARPIFLDFSELRAGALLRLRFLAQTHGLPMCRLLIRACRLRLMGVDVRRLSHAHVLSFFQVGSNRIWASCTCQRVPGTVRLLYDFPCGLEFGVVSFGEFPSSPQLFCATGCRTSKCHSSV